VVWSERGFFKCFGCGKGGDIITFVREMDGLEFMEAVRKERSWPLAFPILAKEAEEEGLLELFRAFGAVVSPPGCGSCIGNGPGIPLSGETTASTTNRNFDRRMGAPGPVYLVSPAVAAASAITGVLTDPRSL
jgi:aconitase B